MGVSLQEAYLGEHVTVRETVELFRSFHREGRGVADTIALLGLEASRDRRVNKLSGGQRQRLALACALVGDPELLFLDEPTTGLDPQARNRLWTVIEEFRASGGTVLLTTHFMDEAARLCDRLVIMDEGQAIARGSPAELIASLHAQQVVEVETEPALEVDWLAALPSVTEVRERGSVRVLAVDDVRLVLPALLDGVARRGLELDRLATHLPTLDDVFLHLTGKDLRDD
jgi:ABC-2 type transport system ATP-binding protein